MSRTPTNAPGNTDKAEDSISTNMTYLNLFEAAPTAQPDKPRPSVKRLLQGDGANLIVFTFSPGHSLPDHRAAHPIAVTSLRGNLSFGCGAESVQLVPGTVVHLKAHVTHRVDYPESAEGDAILLLTMLTSEHH